MSARQSVVAWVAISQTTISSVLTMTQQQDTPQEDNDHSILGYGGSSWCGWGLILPRLGPARVGWPHSDFVCSLQVCTIAVNMGSQRHYPPNFLQHCCHTFIPPGNHFRLPRSRWFCRREQTRTASSCGGRCWLSPPHQTHSFQSQRLCHTQSFHLQFQWWLLHGQLTRLSQKHIAMRKSVVSVLYHLHIHIIHIWNLAEWWWS